MTTVAGLNDIASIYCRLRATCLLNVMGRVAVGTNRSNNQAIFKKTLAVDGHRIILDDIVLVKVVGFGHLRAFTMTSATGEGDIQGIGRCLFI